jgi:hypothetical protein
MCLSSQEHVTSDQHIRELLNNAFIYQFDLASPPLLRVTVIPTGPGRHVVLLVMHHIAMDGWSYGSIWIDVMAFYKANVTGRSPQLREVRVQYSDFAAWEQRHLEIGSKKYEAMVSYWKAQLQFATPVLQLPHDYPRRNHQEHRPAVGASHVVGVEKVEGLKSFASSLKVSLYAICISVFRLMLCEFSATDDVIISSTYSLRPPRTENLVGYFLRMLLLRTRLEENDSFSTLVKREMETLTSGIEQSMLPLQDVLKVSNLPRAPGRTSYWQAVITWDEQGKKHAVCHFACYLYTTSTTYIPFNHLFRVDGSFSGTW